MPPYYNLHSNLYWNFNTLNKPDEFFMATFISDRCVLAAFDDSGQNCQGPAITIKYAISIYPIAELKRDFLSYESIKKPILIKS